MFGRRRGGNEWSDNRGEIKTDSDVYGQVRKYPSGGETSHDCSMKDGSGVTRRGPRGVVSCVTPPPPSAEADGTAFRKVAEGQRRPPHPIWSNAASSSSEGKTLE